MWLDDDDYIDVNTGKDRARAIPFVGNQSTTRQNWRARDIRRAHHRPRG